MKKQKPDSIPAEDKMKLIKALGIEHAKQLYPDRANEFYEYYWKLVQLHLPDKDFNSLISIFLKKMECAKESAQKLISYHEKNSPSIYHSDATVRLMFETNYYLAIVFMIFLEEEEALNTKSINDIIGSLETFSPEQYMHDHLLNEENTDLAERILYLHSLHINKLNEEGKMTKQDFVINVPNIYNLYLKNVNQK